MLYFAHIIDGNLGDRVSCPCHYYDFGEHQELDFRDAKFRFMEGETIVVGGGGMFYPSVDDFIWDISQKNKVIIWGVGLNYNENFDLEGLIHKISRCSLVGTRSKAIAFGFNFDFVPCVSCKHESLDTSYSHRSGRAIYEHFCNPIMREGFQKMDNRDDKSIQDVIRFIGSHDEIITNSFHGAYWASLIGVRVKIKNATSIRFYDIPLESMEECRKLNDAFYEKVKAIL